MVETIPRVPPAVETARRLAALQGLRFDEARLAKLATLMATIQAGLAELEAELDMVAPAVICHLRPGDSDGRRPGE
jgi:hypothetical protein